MNTKQVGILAAITGAVIVAAAVSMSPSDNHHSGLPNLLYPKLGAKLADVSSVLIEQHEHQVTLHRANNTWVVREVNNYPADVSKLRKLVDAMAQMKPQAAMTSNRDNYGKLGVQDAADADANSFEVVLNDSDEKPLADLLIGNQSSDGEGGRYVRKAGESQSWRVSGADTGRLSVDPKTWLDKLITDIPAKMIQSVAIVQPGGGHIDISKAKPTDKAYTLKQLPKGTKLKGAYLIDNLGALLSGLDLVDVRPKADAPLVRKDTVATFTRFDGMHIVVHLHKEDKQYYINLSADIDTKANDKLKSEADGLNAQWKRWSYEIDKAKAEELLRPAKDYYVKAGAKKPEHLAVKSAKH